MSDENTRDEHSLPLGLTDDIAALAAVMADHGLEKIQVDANGIKIVLSAPRTHKGGSAIPATIASDLDEFPAIAPDGAIQGYLVTSPMIGTYYTAPGPGEDPFVRVGDLVAAGQTVAIIEAMKIMNEIQAERGGVVEELLATNGQPVEYNQPLMRLTQ